MSDRKIKHIHSSCGFPAKGEKGKTERFQVYKIPIFFKLQFISSSGHSREKISDRVALQSPRAVA